MAAIGPSISVEHFEVGEEVAAEFKSRGMGDAVVRESGEEGACGFAEGGAGGSWSGRGFCGWMGMSCVRFGMGESFFRIGGRMG